MDILVLLLLALALAGFVLWVISMFLGEGLNWTLESLRKGSRTREHEANPPATVIQTFEPIPHSDELAGKVEYKGAIWDAHCPRSVTPVLRAGERVRVNEPQGMTLRVIERCEESAF